MLSPESITEVSRPARSRQVLQPLRLSVSMDFEVSADQSRSASNSPPATKRYGFKLSLPNERRQSSSQEELTHWKGSQNSILPKCRSVSVGDIVDEGMSTLKPESKKEKRKLSKKTRDISHPLHYPKSSEALQEMLQEGYNPHILHIDGFFPIHTYIDKRKKKYDEFLYILLSQSDADVNWPTLNGIPPLHMAVQNGNYHALQLLLVFGAKINSLDSQLLTALDVAVEYGNESMISLLQSLGAVQGEVAKKVNFSAPIPRLKTFHDTAKIKALLLQRREERSHNRLQSNGTVHHGPSSMLQQCNGTSDGNVVSGTTTNGNIVDGSPLASNSGTDAPDVGSKKLLSRPTLSLITLGEMENGNTFLTLHERLQQCINMNLELSGSFSANTDEAIAITMQQKELLKHNKTLGKKSPYSFNVQEGSRILFLDGGGIRGLVQIEILEQLEKRTGRKVTELFDWIVGTSTGAVVALALVYAKKSLADLRKLYFKMKDKVFGTVRFGVAYNTEVLEQLLKEELGSETKLSDEDSPKVVITAVYKKTTMPELHFFNNCFHDEFSTQLVWKVARYSSAAPIFFGEFEDYVDGGVLANNPCSYGFSAIQNFHRQVGKKLDVALAVSVGSGIFPPEELGKTDAQEFLYFGKHWLRAAQAIKARAKSLITLLTTALGESESVAMSFSSRMEDQGIPFYRFNPQLDEVIPSGEIDLVKLINMQITAKRYLLNPEEKGLSLLDELVRLFFLVAEMNRKKMSTFQ